MMPLAGGISGFGTSQLSGLLSSHMAATFAPGLLYEGYAAFHRDPTALPGPADIFRAFSRGDMGQVRFDDAMRFNGIERRDILPTGIPAAEIRRKRWRKETWEACLNSTLVRPSVDLVNTLWTHGYIDDAEADDLLKKAGADVGLWRQVRRSFSQLPPVGNILEMRNRGVIRNDDDLSFWLERSGYRLEGMRDKIAAMRETLPTVQDIVMHAVRDTFDPEAVRIRELFNELPTQLKTIGDKLGLFGDSGVPLPNANPPRNATWAELHWASHWQPLSPTIAFNAFHRLRPGRANRFRDVGINVAPVGLDWLNRQLKIADYPPGDRDTLAALSFATMRLIDIRRALTTSARIDADPDFAARVPAELRLNLRGASREWAIDQFMDRGHLPDDATVMADMAMADVQYQIAKPMRLEREKLRRETISEAKAAHRLGLATDDGARQLLMRAGFDQATADLAVNVSNAKRTREIATAAIRGIRTDYFGGILITEEIESTLVAAGVQPAMAASYRQLWSVQRNRTRRTATTQQLLGWLSEGLITQFEVVSRLTNLGWSQADQLTLLREAGVKVQRLQAKAITAAEMGRQKRQKELAAAAKEADAVRRRLISQLRLNMPRSTLQSSLRVGRIGVDYFNARLREQGYPEATITLWREEALSGRDRPPAPLNPEPPPAPAATTNSDGSAAPAANVNAVDSVREP